MQIAAVTAAALLAFTPTDPGALPDDVPRVASGPAPIDARPAIEGWLAAVRDARFAAAARFFTVPARVQNVSPVIDLASRRVIAGWNRSLPCGAVLTGLRGAQDGWAIATFRLVERRGGDCGTGTGRSATSAILVRNGLIARWHRLPDPGAEPPPFEDPGRAA